jgi:hypothetical protein
MTSEILLTLNVSFRIQYGFNSIITRLYTYLLQYVYILLIGILREFILFLSTPWLNLKYCIKIDLL